MDRPPARVAVVDDEESIRKALLRLLRLADFDAEAFESAPAFLESLVREHPACVILDLQMPGMTGMELLERMSRMTHSPPVIVITADDTQRTYDECMALGTKRYFRKPVDGRQLLDAIRELLGTS